MMTQPKISVQNVFYTFSDEVEALRNISLDILSNEIFVAVCPARSGKTTLLRLLTGCRICFETAATRGRSCSMDGIFSSAAPM